MLGGDRFDRAGRWERGTPRVALALALMLTALAWATAARAQPADPPSRQPPPAPGAPPPAPAGGLPWGTPYAPPPGAPGSAEWGAAAAPPPQLGMGPRWVYVELRSDDPRTRIDRVLEGTVIPVCFAPCRKMLDTNSLYVIEGEGVRATSKFVLPDDRDSVALDVQAGSTTRLAAGAILMGAGLVTAYIGALAWEASTLSNSFDGMAMANRSASVGETMVIVGVVGAVVGLSLALSTHTTVTSSTGSTFTRDDSAPRRSPLLALTARGLAF